MRIVLLVCLILAIEGPVLSQNTIGLPLIKNFSKTEFHGGSQTWDIDQDSKGRMYFANNEGLLTYDGTYWKLHPLPNKTIMRSVTLDGSGKIYVGGQGEAGYFQADDLGFLRYVSILNLIPADHRDFADIWDIEILGESVFFRASDRIFELTNQSVRVFPAPTEWICLKQVGSQILAQDSRDGLFHMVNNAWSPVVQGKLVSDQAIQGMVQTGKDSLLLATIQNQFFLLTPEGLRPQQNFYSLGSGNIFTMEALNASEFVLGTTNQGCRVINKAGQLIQAITTREGLQDNNIICVYLDRAGNLWVGQNHGISLVAYNSPVKYIRPVLGNELSGYCSRVYKDRLYLATSFGAYSVSVSGANNDLGFLKADFRMVENSQGLGYRFDEVNQRLLMAHNEGTFTIDNERATRISTDPSWMFTPLSPVIPSAQVLVGNYTGLKLLHFKDNRFTATANLEGLRESFRFLAIDNEHDIWASHPYRGIYRIRLKPDSAAYTWQLFTDKEGLPSALGNHVFSIKNRVVFATDSGAYEYDKTKARFVRSAFLDPVLGTTPVRYLKEDGDGNIWFVSGKKLGVLVYQPQKTPAYTVTYFPEVAGQILSGFENVYPYNRENVFVGSEKGMILINLEKYLKTKENPTVLLSVVNAFGLMDSIVSDGFMGLGAGVDGRLTQAQQISLPYHFNSIHFEYSAPAYGFQENIEYAFKLEGYDPDWSKWSPKTEKDYTNLPNGKYVFKVKARSNLGTETEAILYTFSVSPPWYKHEIAYALYCILLISGIYFLRYWYRRNLAREKRKYEEKQAQLRVLHQLEMEKNEKEIMRLQNEKLANEVSFKNKELADTTMHLVERSDALGKVKEELQRLYKSSPANTDIKRAIGLLTEIERHNADWDKFAASFDEINNDFLKKLKARFPALTNSDLKLCAYLQLKMSSKEISQLLNISLRGVEISRYRLRKKLGITTEVSIGDFLNDAV